MEDKVKLKIVGISYSQIRTDAYALILAEENGKYYIPIVIGAAEAQAIAIKMERVNMPRPLTHDLMVSISQAFGVKLTEVYIYKFEDGIFSSELKFDDGNRQIVIDSRTSDGIALAIRTNAPIYTTHQIIEDAGFLMEDSGNNTYTLEKKGDKDINVKLENLTIVELEKLLNRHIELEEYEDAAIISKIIKQKKDIK